jgi:hypothetical protein
MPAIHQAVMDEALATATAGGEFVADRIAAVEIALARLREQHAALILLSASYRDSGNYASAMTIDRTCSNLSAAIQNLQDV